MTSATMPPDSTWTPAKQPDAGADLASFVPLLDKAPPVAHGEVLAPKLAPPALRAPSIALPRVSSSA